MLARVGIMNQIKKRIQRGMGFSKEKPHSWASRGEFGQWVKRSPVSLPGVGQGILPGERMGGGNRPVHDLHHHGKDWERGQDLNLRSSAYETDVLPD